MTIPDHLRIEIDVLAGHARQRLRDMGYTDDEIERAASGLIDKNRLQPTHDGEHVSGAWLYVEVLAGLGDAKRALQRGEIEAAQRHHAEAERNEVAAQREVAGERRIARNTANASRRRKTDLGDIIDQLAKRPGTSGELWNALGEKLYAEGWAPEDDVSPGGDLIYAYVDAEGRPRTISKRHFANRLSEARKTK